ncbi:molybdopterin-synthase adenylyltransferase MoeB [Enterovibrio norvegicus]|uniref:ThiF family adenylyltransferase n=1 Tax=Enterovibrio norvegicus TaxID=188144 RepID=A0ABV4L231_9GAMM|nr:HesA/MoeB/ThiF family protein [Enterovibrio norvegicus]OEF49169.1 molybdopterin-synthase adenylyltransferase MoeB [Enterovibrio norvegicus]OEF59895.1 molybdopterin-synthase adenylyltransferase MoeB [Enterovibrio norvegicus]
MNFPPLSDDAFDRYSRQIMLADWGEKSQQKLAVAKVLIVGCGGLGTVAGLYLAGAGVGHLVLADDDDVESSNLPRQVAYRETDVGTPKAKALSAQLSALNHRIHCRPVERRLSGKSLSLEVSLADLVLDCSDNLETRQAINEACFTSKTPLISGAAIGWNGQLMVFDFARAKTPCYHCLFPAKHDETTRNCQSAGVIGPVVGVIGNFQALVALQYLTQPEKPATRFYHLDGRTLSWQMMHVPQDPACTVCQVQKKAVINEYLA